MESTTINTMTYKYKLIEQTEIELNHILNYDYTITSKEYIKWLKKHKKSLKKV